VKPHTKRNFNCSARNLFRCEALAEPSAAAKMNADEGSPQDDYSLEAERKIGKLFAAAPINLR
jgi:hypothetical protein